MPKNKNGFVLIISYLVIAVLLILGSAYLARSISEWRAAERDKNSLAALYAAEGGIDYGLNWLRLQPSPPSGIADINLPAGPAITTGSYSVIIRPDPNNGSTYLKKYQIISTGQAGDSTRRVNYEVQVDSFARYAYFSNRESFNNQPVWFVTRDTLRGPVHTNDRFNISGNPTFTDIVSQTGPAINYMHGGPPQDNPSFIPGEPELGVPPTSMPSQALNLRAASTSGGGLSLTGATTIALQSNGTMNVTNSAKNWNNTNMPLPANGALFVQNGNLSISGTLNGRLSVGSSNNVIITNNITYNTDPNINPSSTDMLGVIAERDVVVSSSAPYDLTVQASVMALSSSFYVSNWSSPPAKGTLNVYGGIIESQRGPVGTFNSWTNQKVSGYSKNYVYDPRLRDNPPPFYPTTGDYIRLSWREQ